MIQGELFKNLTLRQINDLLEQVPHTIKNYKVNDCIYTEMNFKHEIGMMLVGKASVCKTTFTGQDFMLNFITKGQLFALSALWEHEEAFPATIRAVTDCQVLFLSVDALQELFKLEPSILIHFMDCIGRKILFLNNKIEMLAIPSIKERVLWAINEAATSQNHIKLNKSKLCQQLAISRASLYRVLMQLQDEEYLVLNDDGSIKLLHTSYCS